MDGGLMGRNHYVIEDGAVRQFSDQEWEEYITDPLREGKEFFHGEEGRQMAEDRLSEEVPDA
jgi:hypothetical protein